MGAYESDPKAAWMCLKGGMAQECSSSPNRPHGPEQTASGDRILFENLCCRAVEFENGDVKVTHIQHDGEFCGMKAMVRALHGRLDFETQFVEIEGDFFTCNYEEAMGAAK